jgi:uncharacterized protein YjbI with pentapeptide repeats
LNFNLLIIIKNSNIAKEIKLPTQNKTIKNVFIALDGKTFVKCHFENCNLNYSGLMQVSLKDCTFSKCKWSFSGAARNTIGFMTGMYGLGGASAKVIEKAFDQIRLNATGFDNSLHDEDVLN